MRVVFLDIDGVLNHCNTRSEISPTSAEPLPIPIAPECMARLNRLIAETGAKIVISSSWRTFARWQDLGPALVRHGLCADVIGETPDLVNDEVWLANWHTRTGAAFTYEHLERGWEIREWIATHPEVTGFVILDDVSDMDELKPWLVLTHPNDGLDDPDVERAKWILDRSAEGIELARERSLGTKAQPHEERFIDVAKLGTALHALCPKSSGVGDACDGVSRMCAEGFVHDCTFCDIKSALLLRYETETKPVETKKASC
jgi:hypothetical protein